MNILENLVDIYFWSVILLCICVGAWIILDIGSTINKKISEIERTNYKLIATVQRYYNFIWDNDQASPRSEIVLLYEDKEMNKRCYKGDYLMIKEYLEQWKYYELTTKQLKNILVKLNCKFESEV